MEVVNTIFFVSSSYLPCFFQLSSLLSPRPKGGGLIFESIKSWHVDSISMEI